MYLVENSTAVITDIPVKVYYDTENLVVSGIPDTVEVTHKRPKDPCSVSEGIKKF